MSVAHKFADAIPGFIDVALLFEGSTPSGQKASIAWLKDGETEVILDLADGLKSENSKLTRRMRSYLGGMLEVGDYLKARTKDDEDDVTEDDIERAALMLAFPKVGRNDAALTMLKSHLDALQKHDIIETLDFTPGRDGAKKPADAQSPQAAPRAKVEAPSSAPNNAPQMTTIRKLPETDGPRTNA